MNLWCGEQKFGGESTRELFLVEEGWVNFWPVGEGLHPSLPVEKALLSPHKSVKDFKPHI